MNLTSAPAFVDSRRFGEATVTVISDASYLYAPGFDVPEPEWRRALPEANAEGKLWFGQHVVHIQLGDVSILVDGGLDDPGSDRDREEGAEMEGETRSPGVEAGLATIGIRPEQITHVLITHAHYDHIQGVTVERDRHRIAHYPRARHLIGRGEWEGNPEREQLDSDLSIRLGTIERLGLLELIDGDRDVAPGVTMIHAPGESPGHSIVRVSSHGETFFALGDLFHHACEVEHLDWGPAWGDRAILVASRDRLIAEAVPQNAILVFTHATFPPWGRIVPAGSGYRWESIEQAHS
jgi:glyoxylase-like metal-dependent hydrolase (beta-lactamase superfamily II)